MRNENLRIHTHQTDCRKTLSSHACQLSTLWRLFSHCSLLPTTVKTSMCSRPVMQCIVQCLSQSLLPLIGVHLVTD